MTQAANAILDALLQPPDADRAELAARLLDSLESETAGAAEDGWSEELRARIDEVRGGQVKAVPWAEARARILDDADGDR
jgi:putative addiction module component (TIGR02574 family)